MIKYLLVGLLLANSVWAAPLDRIVAVVNNEIVLDSELVEMEQTVRQQLRQRNAAIPSSDILRRQVLERLIMQKLQLQRAEMSGIRVADDALNAAVRQIAENNNLTIRQFRDALESDGYDFTEFRETIREEMVISRLRKSEVEDSIVVSEREVDNFLATQNLQGDSEQAFRLLHILVGIPDAPTPEQVQEAEKKLAVIQDLLAEGGDFSEIAAGYSDGQNALEGGELGWRKQAELPTLFASVVPNLAVGEVSDVIRSGSGFHLVKLAEKRSEETHLVKQTKARHILIKTNELVTDEAAEKRLQQLRERILNGEDFAELAKAHSEDTGSAIDGGSLGWTSPGVMVPEFEEVMNGLAEGEMSDVFQSRFGWHLIQVEERREQNMADEFKRNKAREQLKQRKIEEELESWLRAMRDEAYIEYRDL
ncbi:MULTISPECIES: peptidylprolyl isomerase [unclassified Methylophaga]|jgi:peptidyl-prolyl cis-trans isomerase SurA|uniref:peptidylprolyl isomerase n=1 Tax=unclassified Methylophaga TaxID=2629249 RepID=UPI000C3F2551|nr:MULTISPECIES: peptidylprolyl isomerase [unclassified Methylophaga]MAL48703.1 molecular chaperone SurA [Methylophaga sp.]MAP25900.1 molecular chaperone SurA [Methylophaga sp.]MBP25250.1 molecular chaperone SurA [Methylophaga sp.]HAD31280.1 molecular chaperone SurA [Methylophaga sp.]|tara:strand:+ start:2298 stop:3563 length:1266 start_codon:yes stop_codon:yes gene_type:complete